MSYLIRRDDKNKIIAVIYAGRNKPVDYIDYFSKKTAEQVPDAKLDEYGNGQYEIQVTEMQTEEGAHKAVQVVKHRQVPTAEQIEKRRKQLITQNLRKEYDINDEIALVKDAINALQVGKEISVDYTNLELAREAAKQDADNEIEADLLKIAREHKDVSR